MLVDKGLPAHWEVENADVSKLWADVVASQVLSTWEGWTPSPDALPTVQLVKKVCGDLLGMLTLVDEEHSEKALLEEGIKICEAIDRLGGAWDVSNMEHVRSVDTLASLHANLSEEWPVDLENFLGQFSAEALKQEIFDTHGSALTAALEKVKKHVPKVWQRWGARGSLCADH